MATPVKFEDRVKLALRIGWTIDDCSMLAPPKHFSCSNWAGLIERGMYEGQELKVLSYFWDDATLYTGTRYTDLDTKHVIIR